ncbi:hypothetical protein EV182_007745, partial [Spiromyces aspiralis]
QVLLTAQINQSVICRIPTGSCQANATQWITKSRTNWTAEPPSPLYDDGEESGDSDQLCEAVADNVWTLNVPAPKMSKGAQASTSTRCIDIDHELVVSISIKCKETAGATEYRNLQHHMVVPIKLASLYATDCNVNGPLAAPPSYQDSHNDQLVASYSDECESIGGDSVMDG